MAAHHRYLSPTAELNHGKRLLISRLAQMLGWDDLKYDTYPGSKLNVWQFPRESRADPATRSITLSDSVPYVTSEDLAQGSIN